MMASRVGGLLAARRRRSLTPNDAPVPRASATATTYPLLREVLQHRIVVDLRCGAFRSRPRSRAGSACSGGRPAASPWSRRPPAVGQVVVDGDLDAVLHRDVERVAGATVEGRSSRAVVTEAGRRWLGGSGGGCRRILRLGRRRAGSGERENGADQQQREAGSERPDGDRGAARHRDSLREVSADHTAASSIPQSQASRCELGSTDGYQIC